MMTKRKPLRIKNSRQQEITHKKFGVRLAHHKHSGKKLDFHHTSYALLFFIIIFTSLIVLFADKSAIAYEQIVKGNIFLSGFSKGPPPEHAAEITSPITKKAFTENIVLIKGTCESDLFVEIYRNTVFAGGTICKDGAFQIYITLVPGDNELVARIHDALGQYGPDSRPVNLFYHVPQPIVPPLLVYTKPIQSGIRPGDRFVLRYQINGGTDPYSVSVNWGDSPVADTRIVQKEGSYTSKHQYTEAGQYTITITATDFYEQKAVIQSTIVVHDAEATAGPLECSVQSKEKACEDSAGIVSAAEWIWPALILASLMTFSFWVGEKVMVIRKSRPKRQARHI